jgi:hypothetical protein
VHTSAAASPLWVFQHRSYVSSAPLAVTLRSHGDAAARTHPCARASALQSSCVGLHACCFLLLSFSACHHRMIRFAAPVAGVQHVACCMLSRLRAKPGRVQRLILPMICLCARQQQLSSPAWLLAAAEALHRQPGRRGPPLPFIATCTIFAAVLSVESVKSPPPM